MMLALWTQVTRLRPHFYWLDKKNRYNSLYNLLKMYNPNLGGILESVLGNSLCVGSGADLEGLDDAGNGLV